MAQTRFQYDYSGQGDAIRQAKKLRSHEFFTVVVQNPKTRRYLVLMCDEEEDMPKRVPIIWQDRLEPPPRRIYSDSDNINAIAEMIEQGVIVLAVVNNGSCIQHESIDDLCSEWIENQSIDWSNWEET